MLGPIDIAYIVRVGFRVLEWLVIARCILSFFRHDPYHPLIKFVYDMTEPIMAPFRRLIPAVGGIDFSPIIVILVIELVGNLVVEVLRNLLG